MSTPRLDQKEDGCLYLSGELSMVTVPSLLSQRQQLTGNGELTIDLDGVERADSAGVALLVQWQREANQSQRKLSFINIPSQMLAIARVSGVDDLLAIPHRFVQEGLETFQGAVLVDAVAGREDQTPLAGTPERIHEMPHFGAHQKQVCHIRAGNQKYQAYGAEYNPEYCAGSADHVVLERSDEARELPLPKCAQGDPIELLRGDHGHAVQVRVGLLDGDTRPQPSHPGEAPVPHADPAEHQREVEIGGERPET